MKLITLTLCLGMGVASYAQPELSVLHQTDCMMNGPHIGQLHVFASMQPNADSLRATVLKVVGYNRVPFATYTSAFSIDRSVDSVTPGVYLLRKEYFQGGIVSMTYDTDTVHMNSCTGIGLGVTSQDDTDCTDTLAPLSFSMYNDLSLRTDVYLVHGLDTVVSVETSSAFDTTVWTGDGFYDLYLLQYYDSILVLPLAIFDIAVKHCISTGVDEPVSAGGVYDYELFDMTGVSVRFGALASGRKVPDVSGLASGTYIVRPSQRGVVMKPYRIVVEDR